MTKDKRFWDRMAEKYSRQPIKDQAAYEKKLEKTRAYFTPESEVLELGCGTGSTAILHAPHVRHILATDISSEMLRIAEDKTRAEGIENITYQTTSFEALDLPENRYDAILALSLLHLLEDWKAAIVRAYAGIKPGGVFVTSTAVLKGRVPLIRLILPIGQMLGVFPRVHFFGADDLQDALLEAGFEIEERWQPEKSMAVFFIARKPA